jgi:hypothetical protein
MVKRPTALYPTQLSLFVRDYREHKGLTQDEFLAELNACLSAPLPAKYVSVLETGGRRTFDAGVFQALSIVTGQTVERLEELHSVPVATTITPQTRTQQSPRIRIACGHVAWGAPLIAATLDGSARGISLATFAITRDDKRPPSAEEAVWLIPGDWPVLPRDFKELRDKVRCQQDQIRNQEDRPSPRATPLSAADALRWLHEGSVDIAAVPGALVENNRDVMRVGQIVDSVSGCTLVCNQDLFKSLGDVVPDLQVTDGPNNQWPRRTITTNELRAGMSRLKEKFSRTDKNFKLAVEGGTVAWQFLEAAYVDCDESDSYWTTHADRQSPFEVEWDCANRLLSNSSFDDLQTRLHKEHGKAAALAGVITWDPHATWLIRRGNGLHAVRMQLGPDAIGRPQHLTFDVIILRKRSGDPRIARVMHDLLWKTWQASIELRHLREDRYHRYLKPLAMYFGIDDDNREASRLLSKMIAAVRFAVSFHIENQHEFPRG